MNTLLYTNWMNSTNAHESNLSSVLALYSSHSSRFVHFVYQRVPCHLGIEILNRP